MDRLVFSDRASEKLRILQQGVRTRAVPLKEEKFHRGVSDSIGNSYSPAAQDFSTYFIYKLLGSNDPLEQSEEEMAGLKVTKHHGNTEPCREEKRHWRRQSYRLKALGARQSEEQLIRDSATQGTDYHPEAVDRSPPPAPTAAPRTRRAGQPGPAEGPAPASRLPGLAPRGGSVSGREGAPRVTKEGLCHRPQGPFQDTLQGPEEDHTCHDEATRTALAVRFPASSTSTHGLSRPASPTTEYLPRYWELITSCFSPGEIQPLSREWVSRICSRVPRYLRHRHSPALQELKQEVEEVYTVAMRKSILDYVLLDPEEQERLGILLQHRSFSSAGRDVFPWRERVKSARTRLRGALFNTHPVMTRLLHSFDHFFADFTLLDMRSLTLESPLTLGQLTDHMRATASRRAGYLQESWLQDSAHIVRENRDVIEAWMPQEDEAQRRRKMAHFFGSVATLMSRLLRKVLAQSLEELSTWLDVYSHGNRYIESYPVSHLALPTKPQPITVFMEACGQQGSVTLSPSPEELAQELCAVVDHVVCSVQRFPRLESQLFQAVDKAEAKFISSVQTEEEMVLLLKAKIAAVVTENSYGPQRYQDVYGPYLTLLSAQMERQLQAFVAQGPSLRSCTMQMQQLQTMRAEIAALPVHLPMELLLLDCTHVNQCLLERTHVLSRLIVSSVMSSSEKFCRAVCQRYENIVARVTEVATTTASLVELQSYVEGLWSGELLELQEKLDQAAARLLFLLEWGCLSREELILYSNTFSWPHRVAPILHNSEVQLQRQRDQAVQRLRARQGALAGRLSETAALIKGFQRKERMAEAQRYVEQLQDISWTIQGFIQEKEGINQEEALLETGSLSPYPEIAELQRAKEPYERLWGAALSFTTQYQRWLSTPLALLNAQEVQEQVQELWRTSYRLTKELHPPELHGPLKAATSIKTRLDKFRTHLPLISALCAPGIKQRHWDLMSEKVGVTLAPRESVPLGELLGQGLERHLEALSEVGTQAGSQLALEEALGGMAQEWQPVRLTLVPYRESGTRVLAAVDDVQTLLEDQLVKTSAMKGSPFIGPFLGQLLEWESQLRLLQDVLDSWVQVQTGWLYLEPIFSSPDLREQMPSQGVLFQAVDRTWRELMHDSEQEGDVLKLLSQRPLLDRLRQAQDMLEEIQKGLSDYLERKRLFFPRFFFLSNEELLEILSETRDPRRVEPHLRRIFPGVARLGFSPPGPPPALLSFLESARGERVALASRIVPSEAQGLVEKWLQQVEKGMQESLRQVLQLSLRAHSQSPREKWLLQWPGQVVLTARMIFWTAEVSQVLSQRGSLQGCLDRSSAQLEEMVGLIRGPRSELDRITLSALITVEVHARDVVVQLHNKGVCDTSDFQWVAQLRYYWEGEQVVVRMITARVDYGYEYLGNTGRLVITPLTDRCYRTLLGAFQLNHGGAPEGPAGTGKTETCKDLAKAVAKQCVVFNCSDGLDYQAMGKFFKGLAQSGVWACFDEFNRIELEVLSVVAQQIQTIQRAISQRVQTFVFEGTLLTLDPTCCIFITMNPGYAGRTPLPDNLKVLFRTVAMTVPDYALIAEISLYAMGFIQARGLAAKIVATYRLCSEQLSSQHHYDYGMRAVKSVLTAAGNLKIRQPEEREDILLLRSITDVNLPKFLSQDIPLFRSIIQDLFPDVRLPTPDHVLLERTIQEVAHSLALQPQAWFITKIIQIYELMLVRHGFILVGGAGGGKSSALRVLAGVLGRLAEQGLLGELPVEVFTLNPKAISMATLYGRFEPTSREWSDGVLSSAFRAQACSLTSSRRWLVLDGPVDAEWVENMNTVLDDNQKLCLMSGETIQMSPQQNIIFEVLDLERASPATISRCGMIYMEPRDLGWEPLLQSWLDRQLPPSFSPGHKQLIQTLLQWLLPPCLEFVERTCCPVVPTSPLHLTATLLALCRSLLAETRYCTWRTPPTAALGKWRCKARIAFSQFFHGLCEGDSHCPRPKELHVAARGLLMPRRHSVFDCVYQSTGWHPWSDLVSPTSLPDSTTMDNRLTRLLLRDTVVVTPQTEIQRFFLERLVLRGSTLLLVGPPGAGKTHTARGFLHQLPPSTHHAWHLTLCSQTTAQRAQDTLLMGLERVRKGVYGAPPGKQMVVFVDDLSLPATEPAGAQSALELLRQLLEHRFCFHSKDGSRLQLQDTVFLSAMTPPSGRRQAVCPRLLRHFAVLSIDALTGDTLKSIFLPLTERHFGRGFETSLRRYARILVWATAEVYAQTVVTFLPTPSKSHYAFNPRDVSRVIQGLALLRGDVVPAGAEGARKLMRLWVHEVWRVFADRLQDSKDRRRFYSIVQGVVRTQFKEKTSSLFGHLACGREVCEEDLRGLFFGDYLPSQGEGGAPRYYDEITDTQRLQQAMQSYLQEYNAGSKTPLDLVLFQFAVEHISRLARVFALPGEHALLIGMGGSGRHSATRLAAYMSGVEVFQVKVQRSYSLSDWHEDLRRLLRGPGLQGTPTAFLFSDHQIKDESFLEELSLILSSGEIPGLFDNEERLNIIHKMQQLSSTQGQSPASLYTTFVQRIRSLLTVVLAFSPSGSTLRDRLRRAPALLNCCTIDYFQAWPDDALQKVACHFLDDVELSQEVRAGAVFLCKYIHQSVAALSERFYASLQRRTYVTPNSYLELLKTFRSLLERQRLELLTDRERYLTGLERLDLASTQIAEMQQELKELEPLLVQRSAETEELLGVIAKETREVEAVKREVEADEATANSAALEAQSIKEECEQQLSVALPALEAAVAALDTLRGSDITLVKTMQNPPAGVRITLAAVCVLKGIKPEKRVDSVGRSTDDYWPAAKKMLGDMKFLESLKDFDKDNIPPRVMAQIRRDFISSEEFQPAAIRAVSSACEGLCSWVRAIEVYDRVAKIVAPKRACLSVAQTELEEQQAKLAAARSELSAVTDRLAGLQERLARQLQERSQLQDSITHTRLKLQRAERLISSLGGERERWQEVASRLGDSYQNIAGDVLLSAGMVAYLGPFTPGFRQEVLSEWQSQCVRQQVPVSPHFSLSSTLGDPHTILEWQQCGLPRDTFSVDNALIVRHAERWPLLLDPEGQAGLWIKTMERDSQLQVCRAGERGYLRTLGNCIQFGTPVLLEGLGEELDPVLDPLMLKQTFQQAGVDYLILGETTLPYSPHFRLYLTTHLPNPHYLPETAAKVTLVNFMVTPRGLQEQLLGILAAKERPELEETRTRLYQEGATLRKQLQEIEEEVLRVLSGCQGSILEDESALSVLASSRSLAREILERQTVTAATEKEIEATWDEYRPVSSQCSLLFFVLWDLARVEPAYQFSLRWFLRLYSASICQSQRATALQERIEHLNAHFTSSVYERVCRSLFERHKLLFSFLLCVGLLRGQGEVDQAEWGFLLTGGVTLQAPPSNPAPDWLQEPSWRELVCLSSLPAFTGLQEHFTANTEEWRRLYDATQPNLQPLPTPWQDALSPFQRLLVLRCLRPDKLIPAILQFISDHLGPAYVEPPTFDLQRSFADSSNCTPLVFLLSPGSDPMAVLHRFSQEHGPEGAVLCSVSLGQGQEHIARRLMEKAAEEGSWVVLQNCHLAGAWLGELGELCEGLLSDPTRPQPSFRLWLTTYPCPALPPALLRDSVKITSQPPRGLRARMQRCYAAHPISDPEFYSSCSTQREWGRLLFALCFFHGVVQERCQYGSLGWSAPYEFNDSDLHISARQLQMLLSETGRVPWEALIYLTGECNYGGRVIDDFDRRLLLCLLNTCYCPLLLSDHNYSFSPSGVYRLPPEGGIQEVLEYIKGLPLSEHPEVFGLHENASIAKETKETSQLFESILGTLPREVSAVGRSSCELVAELAADILSRIPPAFNTDDIVRRLPPRHAESMNAVLTQELGRFNQLTGTVRDSLTQLGHALRGQTLITPELEDTSNSLLLGKVPALWSARSYPSLKPLGSYIADLLQRLQFFQSWVDRGLPSEFWISGFYFPQAFLTGALQNHARRHHLPVDQLSFSVAVTCRERESVASTETDTESQGDTVPNKESEGDSDPNRCPRIQEETVTDPESDSTNLSDQNYGVHIYGLYMEGARWDRERGAIGESLPKILYDCLPVIWLRPRERSSLTETDQVYICPVYQTAERGGQSYPGRCSNLVLTLSLPSQEPPSHWVRRGVACLCQLHY
nr:PREDICTED: dynein heavy chain 3, axonemal-like [Lepisosteus oculatus]